MTTQPDPVRAIYVNLPVKDLGKTRAFWTALGFSFNEQFSDENALCLVLKENAIYAMFLLPEFFSTFTNRPLADAHTTQVLLAIDVGSREKLAKIMDIALANGATRYLPPEDHGWMVSDRFADIDGHQWEIMFADESLLPKE